MALQQDSPRQADLSTPVPQGGTESVVQVPNQKAEGYRTQADGDHLPHRPENCKIALILFHLLSRGPICLGSFRRAKRDFHGIDAPEEYNGGEQGKHILVKEWVFKVMIV